MVRIFRIYYSKKGVLGFVPHGWYGKFSTQEMAENELKLVLSGETIILDDKHGRIDPDNYKFLIDEFYV